MKIPNTTRAAYGIKYDNPVCLQKGALKRHFRKKFIRDYFHNEMKSQMTDHINRFSELDDIVFNGCNSFKSYQRQLHKFEDILMYA
jgi:hypothetical protein